jgi:hypothetical protein
VHVVGAAAPPLRQVKTAPSAFPSGTSPAAIRDGFEPPRPNENCSCSVRVRMAALGEMGSGSRERSMNIATEFGQSPAVQRLRLGPVDLGHQSGEVAEPQAARASRGDPAWISLPGPAWLLPERMETASRFRSGSHRAHRGERSSGYGKRRQNQGSHRTLRWREMDSNFRFLVGSTPPRCAPR